MRKYSKKAQIGRLRKLLYEALRLRVLKDYGKIKCERCGRDHGKMDTSHIFPKGTYKTMQFELENVVLLCFNCHRNWWHLNPILATEWVIKHLGDDNFTLLRLVSLRIGLFNRAFLDQTEIRLKEKIAELNERLGCIGSYCASKGLDTKIFSQE